MMDSGSSISLIMESFAKNYNHQPPTDLNLISAAGEPIPVIGQFVAPIRVGNLLVDHNCIVIPSLITPVILGLDFLHKHRIILDFTTIPVSIHNSSQQTDLPEEFMPILNTARNSLKKVCAVTSINEPDEDVIDSCTVPLHAVDAYEIPNCQDPDFMKVLEKHRQLYQNMPGKTNVAEHFIPTEGNPVKIPPRRIPANYQAEVEHQISSMLQQGIIRVSSSP